MKFFIQKTQEVRKMEIEILVEDLEEVSPKHPSGTVKLCI